MQILTLAYLLIVVFCGDWNDYYESYTWQALAGNHSAVGDCQAALSVLKEMAESEIIDVEKAFENAWSSYRNRQVN